jgi:chromosome segregation ATPase
MKRAVPYLVALFTAIALPTVGHGQTAAPATLDTLLQEVRLLRKAIEKQGVTAARTQLLMGRIALQEQRLARARDLLERVDGQLMAAERERDHLRSAAAEFAHSLEEATDEARRAELESAVRNVRVQVTDQEKVLSEIRTRHTQAQQALEAETSRYDELDSWLRDLDRELQRTGP